MRTLEITQATDSLANYAKGMADEPLVLTLNGEPVAALVKLENGDLESLSLSTNPRFLAILEKSRARLKAEGGISPDEMRRRLGLAK